MNNPDMIRSSQRSEIPIAFAGFPSPAEDYLEKSLDLNRLLIPHPAATFLMRATGDPLLEAGIWPGDILIVDRSLDPAPHRVAVMIVEGELRLQQIGRNLDGEIWGIVTAGIHFIR
jgi:DNA polymerase V